MKSGLELNIFFYYTIFSIISYFQTCMSLSPPCPFQISSPRTSENRPSNLSHSLPKTGPYIHPALPTKVEPCLTVSKWLRLQSQSYLTFVHAQKRVTPKAVKLSRAEQNILLLGAGPCRKGFDIRGQRNLRD